MLECYAGPRPDSCLGCGGVIKPGDEVIRFNSKWFVCFACCETQIWQGTSLPMWEQRLPPMDLGRTAW